MNETTVLKKTIEPVVFQMKYKDSKSKDYGWFTSTKGDNKSGHKSDWLAYVLRDDACAKDDHPRAQNILGINCINYAKADSGLLHGHINDWEILTEKNISIYRNQLREVAKHKGIVWHGVISFDTKFADKYNLWDRKTQFELFKKPMMSLIVKNGFNISNFQILGAFHINTPNPHIHFMFYQNRQVERKGVLPKSIINGFRFNYYNHILNKLREPMYQNLNLMRNETSINFTNAYKQLRSEKKAFVLTKLMELGQEIYPVFKNKKRLFYGNKEMIPYCKNIDKISDFIIKNTSLNFLKNEFDNENQKINDLYKYTADQFKVVFIDTTQKRQEKLNKQLGNQVIKLALQVNIEKLKCKKYPTLKVNQVATKRNISKYSNLKALAYDILKSEWEAMLEANKIIQNHRSV